MLSIFIFIGFSNDFDIKALNLKTFFIILIFLKKS